WRSVKYEEVYLKAYSSVTDAKKQLSAYFEFLWRSVKYEEVYLKAYSSVTDAKKQLSAYFEFYNLKRPHSSLDKMTPNEFYYDQLPQQNKVA
ncbi:integrase core domain-containing protein, partial [Acinetobacter pittii]|uniref:integrase core domain-containing protein n=1 Tax=Acinetobacter pittii TaxID=48296 RepID=UPI001D176186